MNASVMAPALITGYGLVRLVDQRSHPGWAWPVGHLLMLAALGLFAVVLRGLRRRVPGRWADGSAFIAAVGLAALVAQFSIDLVVGALAPHGPQRQHYFAAVQSVPGVLPVVYTVVPVLFYLGLCALLVVAAVVGPRPLPWWSPVLAFAGSGLPGLSLDLLPVAGILYLIALLPLRGHADDVECNRPLTMGL